MKWRFLLPTGSELTFLMFRYQGWTVKVFFHGVGRSQAKNIRGARAERRRGINLRAGPGHILCISADWNHMLLWFALRYPICPWGGGICPDTYMRVSVQINVRVRWENLIFHNFKFGKVPPPMVFRYAQIGWGKKVGQIYIHNHDRYYDHNHCLVLAYSRPSLSDKPVDEVGIK